MSVPSIAAALGGKGIVANFLRDALNDQKPREVQCAYVGAVAAKLTALEPLAAAPVRDGGVPQKNGEAREGNMLSDGDNATFSSGLLPFCGTTATVICLPMRTAK